MIRARCLTELRGDVKPVAPIADRMRASVSGLTRSSPFRKRETVDVETPASRATAEIDMSPLPFLWCCAHRLRVIGLPSARHGPMVGHTMYCAIVAQHSTRTVRGGTKMAKVLLAGESWVSATIDHKGYDPFPHTQVQIG